MARFASLLFSSDFVAGATRYRDDYPGEEQFARIVLPVTVQGRLTVQAIVDTGAPWCILAPEIIRQLGVTVGVGHAPSRKLKVRGISYEGNLIRMGVSLRAGHGESLEVDATVFVPMLPPGEIWPHPNFIGLDGFLNRIRFAVDPEENAFYFGPI